MALAFFDDFNGTQLNEDLWTYDLGSGEWGNGELENYAQSNVSVSGGNLVITATENQGQYYSGRVKTLGKFSAYQRTWEARIKITPTQGLVPAFWLMGVNPDAEWPQCGEIDVMENFGDEDVWSTVWTPHPSNTYMQAMEHTYSTIDPAAFHVYRVYQGPAGVRFWVDNVAWTAPTYTSGSTLPLWGSTYSSGNPLYALLNLAIQPGVDPSTLPVSMLVDYVKAW